MKNLMSKKLTLVVVLSWFGLSSAYSQLAIGYHQSNLPFLGVNYEFGDRWNPEFRVGTDNFIEDISLELVANYDIIDENNHEVYLGIGARTQSFEGVVIPAGVRIYPFQEKRMGFHMELAVIIEDDALLRGSWGLRYNFGPD